MPSRWDSATCGRRRRVFHYPPPTLMSRNYRLPCAVELQPLSLTPLKMRKVELRYQAPQRAWTASKSGSGAMVPLPKKPSGFKTPTTTESQPPRDHSPHNCRPPAACTTSRGNGT